MSEHFPGGSAVPGGYYLNPSRWAVALVPILGVTFVIFMPVAGFVVLFQHLVAKLRGLFARAPAPPTPAVTPPREQGESRRASQG